MPEASARRSVWIFDAAGHAVEPDAIYPTLGLVIQGVEERAPALALCRAVNDWVAEYCRHAPERLLGIGTLPMAHPGDALDEARRCVERLGMRGVWRRPEHWAGIPRLHDARHEPLFAYLAEAGVPLAIHPGLNGVVPYASIGERFEEDYAAMHAVHFPVAQMLSLTEVIAFGILERHPALRLAFLETGAVWALAHLHRLDEHLETFGFPRGRLSLRPSEYFRRQCFVSCEAMEPGLDRMLSAYPDSVVFASDYPHGDCSFPGSTRELLETPALDDATRERVLRANALRLYGLAETPSEEAESRVGRRAASASKARSERKRSAQRAAGERSRIRKASGVDRAGSPQRSGGDAGMANARRFRFGVVLRAALSGREWAEKARELEGLGFDVLLVSDHLVGPRLAPLAALAAAAAATTTLRVGTLVLGNDFRHPALLAKEAATLDLLSGGRLELGIGAGWMRADYDQAGLRYDPPAVRIERLRESLQILKGLWGEGAFSFSGRHYAIEAAEQVPRPLQRPHPPILIGGGGPALLRLAARRADSVNLTLRAAPDGSGPNAADVGLAPLLRKLSILREAAGERWERLEIGTSVWALAVGSGEVAVRSGFLAGFVAAMADTPNVLAGEAPAIVDKLQRWRAEHAVSYYVLQDEAFIDAFAPIVARLAGT